MKGKKLLWLVVSGLMVASLLLWSCGEAEPTGPTEPAEPTEPAKPAVPTTPRMWEKPAVREPPKYGGEMNSEITTRGFGSYDPCRCATPNAFAVTPVMQPLQIGNWTHGPTGTNEYSMLIPSWPGFDHLTNCLCETWEIVDGHTFMIKLREGIHWQNKEPAWGAEMTAEDIAFCFEKSLDIEHCGLKAGYNLAATPKGYLSIEVLDRYTVKVVTPPELLGTYLMQLLSTTWMYPKCTYDNGGDMMDWRRACGTGPYMLTEWVQDSFAEYTRNPDFWMKDPYWPENQLPYLDKWKMYAIQDYSTALASLVTGKIDRWWRVPWETGDTILKERPDMQYFEYLDHLGYLIGWRHDVPPFNDVRVRRACMLAVDQDEIVRDYLKGRGGKFGYYIRPYPENRDVYVTWEDSPEDIQILYEYHPDMARELLAEAGYPDGFTFELITSADRVEPFEIMKEYFAKVGIVMNIEILELSGYYALCRKMPKTFKHTVGQRAGHAFPRMRFHHHDGNPENQSNICLPGMNEAYQKIMANWFNAEVRDEEVRKLEEKMKREVWFMPFPANNVMTMWQPWLKGYGGEYACGMHQRTNYHYYVWIDQELKEELGY